MTLTDRVAEHFKAHPDMWLDAHEFVALGGFAGFTARIRDCRKPPLYMSIENVTERKQTSTG